LYFLAFRKDIFNPIRPFGNPCVEFELQN